MSISFDLKIILTFFAIIIFWLKFLQVVMPKHSVSGPESIGRALGFLFVTEIAFSVVVALFVVSVNRNIESPILNEMQYFFKLVGFYAIASVGSYISMKTNEGTCTMNLKIYSLIGALPNLLVSLPSFGEGGVLLYSLVGVPIVSFLSGIFLLKKYSKNYKN